MMLGNDICLGQSLCYSPDTDTPAAQLAPGQAQASRHAIESAMADFGSVSRSGLIQSSSNSIELVSEAAADSLHITQH